MNSKSRWKSDLTPNRQRNHKGSINDNKRIIFSAAAIAFRSFWSLEIMQFRSPRSFAINALKPICNGNINCAHISRVRDFPAFQFTKTYLLLELRRCNVGAVTSRDRAISRENRFSRSSQMRRKENGIEFDAKSRASAPTQIDPGAARHNR